MAALYGRLQGQAGEATRIGSTSSGIHSKLETWNGSITTELQADGTFEVFIGPKGSGRTLIASGNVDEDRRYAHGVRNGDKLDLLVSGGVV